jgi:hypothetical protein
VLAEQLGLPDICAEIFPSSGRPRDFARRLEISPTALSAARNS